MNTLLCYIYGCARTGVERTCQASTHLGKREQDDQPIEQRLSKLVAIAAARSTSQAARSAAGARPGSSQVLGRTGGGINETQRPSRQARGIVHTTLIYLSFHAYCKSIHAYLYADWCLNTIAKLTLWQILSTGSVFAPRFWTEMKLRISGFLEVSVSIGFGS